MVIERLRKIPTQIWILILVVILGVTVSFLFITRDDVGSLNESVLASHLDSAELLRKISAHIQLPDEEPVVVEIKDIDLLLSESSFYRGAQNGDFLLIFAQTQRAYLYSLARDVVINAGPVQFDNSGAETQNTNRAITIEIRNGTGVSGEASKLSRSLNTDILFAVIKVDDAAHTNYTETILVNRTGTSISTQVQALAERTGARIISSLPLDEANSVADVVLILGKN